MSGAVQLSTPPRRIHLSGIHDAGNGQGSTADFELKNNQKCAQNLERSLPFMLLQLGYIDTHK